MMCTGLCWCWCCRLVCCRVLLCAARVVVCFAPSDTDRHTPQHTHRAHQPTSPAHLELLADRPGDEVALRQLAAREARRRRLGADRALEGDLHDGEHVGQRVLLCWLLLVLMFVFLCFSRCPPQGRELCYMWHANRTMQRLTPHTVYNTPPPPPPPPSAPASRRRARAARRAGAPARRRAAAGRSACSCSATRRAARRRAAGTPRTRWRFVVAVD